MSLEFEKNLEYLEATLQALSIENTDPYHKNYGTLEKKIAKTQTLFEEELKKTYKKLSAWDRVLVARHPSRPRGQAYVEYIFSHITYLSGDRLYGKDSAILGGVGQINNQTAFFIAHNKGTSPTQWKEHNYGMPHPEGYRTAQRIMKLAEKFDKPVICFVDTPGAYPGYEAEKRGQAEAIAKTIEVSLGVNVPIIAVIIGEGGSGGAVALSTANQLFMLENSVYSVISPEGGSSILYRTQDKKKLMAAQQKLTAKDLLNFKIIDEIIPEKPGGAHRFPQETLAATKERLIQALNSSKRSSWTAKERQKKFIDLTRSTYV